MSHLIALFLLGFKRFFNKRNLIAFLGMFLLLLYGVNKGIDNYKVIVQNSKEFQQIEVLMFSNFMSYTHYSLFGVHYFFVPSASSIFFTDLPMMSELSAKIDSISTVNIYSYCKGGAVFKGNKRGFLRFSGILILLGTLFALFTGYESMCRRDYLKFLCSSFSRLKVFLALIFSRFILIILTVMVMFVSMLGVVRLRGIELTTTDFNGLWAYLGTTLLTLLIFLVIGGMIGTIRSNTTHIILILGVWIGSVFIIPGIVDSIIEERADDIFSSYKSDLNKIQEIKKFEGESEEKYGKFDRKNIVTEREIMEDFWKNDYPKIALHEEKLIIEVAEVIDKYKRLSILFPTTFYNLTAQEVSSRGYENYLEFYREGHENQLRFGRFFIDRVFYNDPDQLVSFTKGDENIFHARSRIPGNFVPGLMVHLFYALALLLGSYIRFKKWLYTPIDKKAFNEKDRNIQLKQDRINVLYSHRPGLREQLYLLLAGKNIKRKSSMPSLNVTLEGERITGTSSSDGFVYICHPSAIPGDIKPVDLISFIARTNGISAAEKAAISGSLPVDCLNGRRFNFLEPPQQAEVLLSVLPYIKGNIYLVDQIGKDMPLSILVKLKDQLQTLAKKGALVIYLTPDKRVEALPTRPEREVLNLPEWFEAVEAHRFLLDEETGKWRIMARPEK
ncbi:MAG: ABC transporter permease subunit [Candidatus Aminicenantes bacterium]|nr:MAG: ABC transporter permease subunit [Candidatus Aminicenantes bacterium]